MYQDQTQFQFQIIEVEQEHRFFCQIQININSLMPGGNKEVKNLSTPTAETYRFV